MPTLEARIAALEQQHGTDERIDVIIIRFIDRLPSGEASSLSLGDATIHRIEGEPEEDFRVRASKQLRGRLPGILVMFED